MGALTPPGKTLIYLLKQSFGERSHFQGWVFSNDLAHHKYVENKSQANILLAKKIFW